MEKDINLIIDIEPEEAELLINLIEYLINEWYIAKHESEKRMLQLINLGEKKDKKNN